MTPGSAHARLRRALTCLAASGRRPRCSDPEDRHLWLSDERADRTLAAQQCGGCPVLELCAAAGEETRERFVWGGRDREPSKNRTTTREGERR